MRNKILRYMRLKQFDHGPVPTWWMVRAGLGNARTLRRELRKMEAEGLVRVSKRYTDPSNNLVWELVEPRP